VAVTCRQQMSAAVLQAAGGSDLQAAGVSIGTQFTCCPSTIVQMLTLEVQACICAEFTCFDSTNVQIVTPEVQAKAAPRDGSVAIQVVGGIRV
jgi:hypothetical protein